MKVSQCIVAPSLRSFTVFLGPVVATEQQSSLSTVVPAATTGQPGPGTTVYGQVYGYVALSIYQNIDLKSKIVYNNVSKGH